MPERFEGKTLVAFVDISGFKLMMKQGLDAKKIMKNFYNGGFNLLFDHNQMNPHVEGFFVSDCGILFVRRGDPSDQIENLLLIVKKLNRKMLESGIMLTSSIAYGDFLYLNLQEHNHIEKSYFYGNGYLNAYLNAEIDEPKLEPGQCRITTKGLKSTYIECFEVHRFCLKRGSLNLETIDKQFDDKYFYYYWMVDNPSKIREFEIDYTDSYKLIKEYKYPAMKRALEKASENPK